MCGACGSADAAQEPVFHILPWFGDEPTDDPEGEPADELGDDPGGCGCPRILGVRLGWWILAAVVLLLVSR